METVKAALLSVVSLLVFGLIIEFGCYLYLQKGKTPYGINHFKPVVEKSEVPLRYHPLRMRAQAPNARFGNEKRLTTDAYGYLTVPERSPNPALTIAMTGSSAARSPKPFRANEELLAYQVQLLARARFGAPINVVSLAAGGYTSFQELMSLYEYLEVHRLPADLIVSANGLYSTIEVLDGFEKNAGGLYPIYEDKRIAEYQRLVDQDITLAGSIVGQWFVQNTNFGRLIDTKLGSHKARRRPPFDYASVVTPDPVLVDQLARREITNLKMMNVLASQAGAPFSAFLLPSMNTLPETGSEARDAKFLARRNWINAVNAILLKDSGDLSLVDLRLTAFPLSVNAFYSDSSHYTPAGTEAVAKVMFETLAPAIEARLKASSAMKDH